MKEVDLDPLASKWVDAIKYKQEAAQYMIKCAEGELRDVSNEKAQLLAYLVKVHGINTDKQDFSLNAKDKKFLVSDKPEKVA